MIAATGGTPATPLVRVPGVGADLVKPVLDCGALGVVFPQVATRADAEATVQAVRYAPEGRRGYGPTYAALRWGLSITRKQVSAAQGNARNVPSMDARAPGPGGAKGRTAGVAPVRATASICARHASAEPTAPRPSRRRSEIPFTAPARSPAFQAPFTASTSSDRKSTRLNSSHVTTSRMPSSA